MYKTVKNQIYLYFRFCKRNARITNLCNVMGIDYLYDSDKNPDNDPDPTYELTTDNVEKILAIHMRFRLVYICFKRSSVSLLTNHVKHNMSREVAVILFIY